jgi:hypothetical protein
MPKHGSWLTLIEGFVPKFGRSVLRHIRATSKHELKERIISRHRRRQSPPWSYKIALADKLARIAWAVLNKGRALECVKTQETASRAPCSGPSRHRLAAVEQDVRSQDPIGRAMQVGASYRAAEVPNARWRGRQRRPERTKEWQLQARPIYR